jgi:hypothetical protein
MSVDFNSMPKTEPGLGESDTPMFAGVPSWERNRKRRSFGGGKTRTVAVEPVAPRNAADVPVSESAFVTAPIQTTRVVKKSGGSVAPLAIAAGIIAIGGLAAAGWYASQPHDTGVAQLTPGTESAAPTTTAPMPQVATNLAPMPGESATAPAAAPTPAKAETPAPRASTRVAAAAPARARPAASRSAEDAGVNTSATLPAAPQPYSGAAVAPSAPADVAPVSPPVEAAPQPVNPSTPPTEAAPQVTPPAAATPPVQTPPST